MKMTELSIEKIRIPIMAALAIGEIIGLIHFDGHPVFIQFIVLSIVGLLLIVPLLWMDVMRQLKIPYSVAILISLSFSWGANSWKHGDSGFALVWATLLLVSMSTILVRVYTTFLKH
jgi:hypothetical protein